MTLLFLGTDGNYGQEHQNLQHIAPNIQIGSSECLTQPPQLELVGHSIVSAFSQLPLTNLDFALCANNCLTCGFEIL